MVSGIVFLFKTRLYTIEIATTISNSTNIASTGDSDCLSNLDFNQEDRKIERRWAYFSPNQCSDTQVAEQFHKSFA